MLYKMINKFSMFLYHLRLRNKRITIISRDCMGGILYSQFGLQFQSPTINLFFSIHDFNFFCLYLRDYLHGNLEPVNIGVDYPTGKLKAQNKNELPELTIHFMHYKSCKEAFASWNRRVLRVNYDNIYVVSSCMMKDEVDINNIQLFNSIKYKKIIIVNDEYGFDDEFLLPNAKYKSASYHIDKIKNNSWKRNFNSFDFVSFFNK